MANESTVTVKLWGVFGIVIAVCGFFFLAIMSHESRITKVETQFPYITESLAELRSVTKDIREDQVRRYRQELREAKQ